MSAIRFFKRYTTFEPIYELENIYNSLQELAIFLRTEVDCFGSSSWIRFLNTAQEGDETSGNLMTIERKGYDAYIGNIHYSGLEDEQEYFIVSIPELIKLMKQWEKLMEEKPEEIILSEQNGKFELTGKNYQSKKTVFEDVEC